MPLSDLEKELIQTVVEDLFYLSEIVTDYPPDHVIRITLSPMLRRLLNEDNLGKCWRLLGYKKQPMVMVPGFLAEAPPMQDGFTFSRAYGIPGGTIGYVYFRDRPSTDEELKELDELQARLCNAESTISISTYMQIPVIRLQGWEVTRADIVKHIANKTGGTHFDLKDRDEILDGLRIRGAAGYDQVMMELVSIARYLLMSNYIKGMATKAIEVLRTS